MKNRERMMALQGGVWWQRRPKSRNFKSASLILGLLLWGVFNLEGVFAAPAPVMLKLWTHERHMAELTRELANEFNATVGREKGIRIAVRVLGDGASAIFQASQRKREGPDLYSTNFNTGYADRFQSGAQIWLDGLPGFKEWKAAWPSWYWQEGVTTYHGRVFAIPVQVLNSRLIYNRDLFRQVGWDPDLPPRTYEEVRAIAHAITLKSKGAAYGFAYCGADAWQTEWMPSQWAEANGQPAYWDWKKGCWNLTGYYPVFQLLAQLEKEKSMFPGTAFLNNDALRAQFAEGRIGMFMGEFWDVGVLNEQFPSQCDWSVGPIPTYDGKFHGKSRAMLLGGFWNINGLSRYQLQAWEVVKWFSRYEVRAKMVEQGKIIDPDPKVMRQYVRKTPTLRGYRQFAQTLNQDYLASYPVLPGWQTPPVNPCNAYRTFLLHGGDLRAELRRIETLWNNSLAAYYCTHPEVRGQNTYWDFNPRTGYLGKPSVKPE